MVLSDKIFVIEMWGDFACFTRPELKVERFSYPVMTPSAARGVLDAVYCKPAEFGWHIKKIEVLSPVRYIALRRNEVKEKISVTLLKRAMEGKADIKPVIVDATKEMCGTDQEGRTQRQTMALQDVHYRVHAVIEPRKGQEFRLKALTDQAERRIRGGKCYYQPYFGCKEFPAFYEMHDPAIHSKKPVDINMEIGFMIFDVFDIGLVETDGNAKASVSIFKAAIRNGSMEIPDFYSDEVLKPGGRR